MESIEVNEKGFNQKVDANLFDQLIQLDLQKNENALTEEQEQAFFNLL